METEVHGPAPRGNGAGRAQRRREAGGKQEGLGAGLLGGEEPATAAAARTMSARNRGTELGKGPAGRPRPSPSPPAAAAVRRSRGSPPPGALGSAAGVLALAGSGGAGSVRPHPEQRPVRRDLGTLVHIGTQAWCGERKT